ncbi:helicase-related protein [Paenibacillus caui]|uniref:helicase-related protein n=1 Tax=Paenibacillus caui TaxID=2873927 RepID=UPI001CAA0FBF|nr:helicase-related protein [Paenibacillus caui]
MKAALYVVKVKGRWQAKVSLDLRMDLLWWTGGVESHRGKYPAAECIVLIMEAAPLGQAAAWRDQFVSMPAYDRFDLGDWGKLISTWRRQEEKRTGTGAKGTRSVSLWRSCALGGREISRKPGLARDHKDAISGSVQNRGLENARQERDEPLWLYRRSTGITPDFRRLLAADASNKEGMAALRKLPMPDEVEQLSVALAGRSLLLPELRQLLDDALPLLAGSWRTAVQLAHLSGSLQLLSGVAPPAGRRKGLAGLLRGPASPRCRRCGSAVVRTAPCASCGESGCAYCEACLALGRSRACALLLRGSAGGRAAANARAARPGPPTGHELDRWGLSPAQREAAAAALRFLAEPNKGTRPARFLLWAVTGAGKTEMIFPLLAHVLEAGGRALVATPRRDVVLELAPRIAKAFPAEKVNVLYGGSSDRWQSAPLVLATTHQLLRFHKAFDLVIIDELDAFPYHNDPMLAFAAEACCRDDGHFIFLSATPPRYLQREAAAGKCMAAKVPARFHGHPLPVPRRIQSPGCMELARRRRLGGALRSELKNSINRGAQIFMFVSRIKHILPLVSLLRTSFPDLVIEGTSSQDGERASKVLAFRSCQIRILVTTTILERGVTVPRSDVFILDADSGLFDEASLVQMAGRAGRSKDDPAGKVLFFSPQSTLSQRWAIRQIQHMNRIAKARGYISSEKAGKEGSG